MDKIKTHPIFLLIERPLHSDIRHNREKIMATSVSSQFKFTFYKIERRNPQKNVCLNKLLTQSLVNPSTVSSFAPAVLLEAGQTSNTSKTKLLIDEEEEYGQQDDKDAHSRQEAHRLRSDW